jgi:hypothetical protein
MGIRKHRSRQEERFQLPAPVQVLMGGLGSEAVTAYAKAEDGVQRIRIAEGRVEVSRRISGIDTTLSVPTDSFKGVTLRNGEGTGFEITLLHIDPCMTLPLYRAADDRDIIAIWRRYASTLGLPLLVEDREGRLQCVSEETPRLPFDRRGGSPLKNRRPRFLSRRAMGRSVETSRLPDWRHTSGQWFFSDC